MKNKIFTISNTDLDASVVTPIQLDVSLTISSTTELGGTVYETLYPIQLRVENDSGITVNWNIIDNQDEFDEYSSVSAPDYYQLLPIATGNAVINPLSQQVFRMIVQASIVGATGNFVIFCINYRSKMFNTFRP